MPLPKELSFKSGAKYAVGQAFSDSYTSTEREQLRQLLVSPDIFVSRSAAFSVKYLDLYYKYEIPATEGNIDVAHRWHNSQMDFWQTQLNFATWCATTGCGVSVHDHLNGRYDFAPESAQLSKSIFRFHVYYQTRRILHQIRAALPQKSPGTLLTMSTTTQPTKRSAKSLVWTHSRGTATGDQPGGHNGWPTSLALTWTVSEFTFRVT